MFGGRNKFKYSLYMVLLNLDSIEHDLNRYWFCSYNKFNILSFNASNYGSFCNESVYDLVKSKIYQNSGVFVDKILILTNLSCLGYCINPISIYFGYNNNSLVQCMFEVTNTPWGEVHQYFSTPKKMRDDVYSMEFSKKMHVSPFIGMNYNYSVILRKKEDSILVNIRNLKEGKCDFYATLSLKCHAISNRGLAWVLLKYPLITLRIFFRIYWQALKLWFKKNKIYKHKEYDNGSI